MSLIVFYINVYIVFVAFITFTQKMLKANLPFFLSIFSFSIYCLSERIYICVYVNVCLCVYMCVCRRSLIVLSFRHDNAKVGDGVLDAVLVTLRKVEKTFIIVIVIII